MDVSNRVNQLGTDKNELALEQYLTFKIGDEEYGINISKVIEIVGIQKINEIPDSPNHVKGVINLRNKIIPVVDMRILFSIDAIEYNDRTCVIIVDLNSVLTGLIVDGVSEVIDIKLSDIEPPPQFNKTVGNRYISGLAKINSSIKILVEIHNIVFDQKPTHEPCID